MTARAGEQPGASVLDAVPAAPAALDPRRWLALAVALLAVFMNLVDTTIVNVALPSIHRDLGTSGSALQWIVAGYTLAFGLALMTGGRLGDIHGRKRVFLVGVAGFVLASALAGVAPSPGVLVGARVLQGAMAALMVPQVLAFVHVGFPTRERPKAFAVYGMTFALGGVSGPLLGGILTQADLFGWGWRTIFWINVPIGLLTLVGAAVLLRGSRAPGATRLDVGGTVLAASALLALLYPLVQGHRLGWPAWTYVCMAACVPLLLCLAAYERSRQRAGAAPLADPGLFRHRSVVGGLAVAVVFFAGIGFTFVLTLYLQEGLGYSPLGAGLSMLPFSLGVVLGSGASMRLVPRLGRRLVTAGAVLMASGMAVLVATLERYGSGLEGWQLAPGMLVAGLGMSTVASTLVNIVLAGVPERDAGSASGMVNTTLEVGVAAGIALIGTAFFARLDAGYLAAGELSLGLAAGLYVLAACLSFVLPAGRAAAGGGAPAATNLPNDLSDRGGAPRRSSRP